MCILAAMTLSVAVHAAEPPSEPILRIDSGEHTGEIRRISADRQGRYLVTASNDKTARIWDLRNGQLLKTLRIPIGPEQEGQLKAVAMSPDGDILALGGWTQFNNGGLSSAGDGHTIYLINPANGQLIRSLKNVPNIIFNLDFSPDGRWLVASIGNGISIFDTSTGNLLAEDRGYGADCLGAHFYKDGRLVTASYDGLLRLYRFDGSYLTQLAKRAAPGGNRPDRAQFSPDGQSIAVGFDDKAIVNVLDASNLELRFSPDATGLTGNFQTITWSKDGSYLYAAGYAEQSINGQVKNFVRRWSGGGAGVSVDWPLASGSLNDMVALPSGKLAYAGNGSNWGVVDSQGHHAVFHTSVGVDFHNHQASFSLSADGAQVGFSSVVFDSAIHAFVANKNLNDPLLNSTNLSVTDWKDSITPKLNGVPLTLERYESSHCAALLPSGEGVVIGTDWYLRNFDSKGNLRWKKSGQGRVWAVNVSQDGRWVVAAYGDGTIRWHRASDGIELLAFFPHADKKRWVMWTPTGYYDASPGAEDLIGWHVNRGKDQAADFFPASRFRSQFYRPDVLDKILDTQDESIAVRLADRESGRRVQSVSVAQALPPVVELMSPVELQTGATTVTLRYTTRAAADAPVTAVRVRVNGQAQSGERVLRPVRAEGEQSIQVTIPPQNSEIQVFAENRFGVSVPVTVRVTWKGKVAAAGFVIKPKLYVLAVGVANYSSADIPKLGLSAKDARDFAATMQKQTGLYREVEVRLLTETEATRDNVVDGLEWLQKQVTQHDVGMLFMAGHGVNDATAGYYYLPVDANPDKLKRTGVSMADIRGTLASLTGKAVFFIDTCHAGNALGGGRRALDNNLNGVINELSSAENGVVVFSSSTGSQYSLENAAWGNGAFTKALIEGMNGGADYQRTGRITHKMLDLFISERVKALTNGQQSPVTQAPGGVPDFPVAAGR
jgi:WD40 repeat protein